jgi:uncharacterized protein YndB with AHSA1/START domain
MPNPSTALDLAFGARSDPARRAMVQRLTRGPSSVSELARPLALALPAVLQHRAVLEDSGLIRSHKRGRVRTCRINPDTLNLAQQWINARRGMVGPAGSARAVPGSGHLTAARSGAAMSNLSAASAAPSVVHAEFHIERTLAASPQREFRAFADPAARALWFSGTPGKSELLERVMDFRVGGREVLKAKWTGGRVRTFDAVFHAIIQDQRILCSYNMFMEARKLSVSLATIPIRAAAGGTPLKGSEQGALLDGF